MTADKDFQAWPKIPRAGELHMTITEKIDGTNAHILIPEEPTEPILAASRSRYVTPERDNFGFARWVAENEEALRRLGPGRHYGEWYGSGIQRTYGLTEKRFALFNVWRWKELPEGCPVSLVPNLYQGPILSMAEVTEFVDSFRASGSAAVPGFMAPEGVVINVGGNRWKITDAEPGKKEVAA